MFTLVEGRKELKKAFKVYKCDFCGYEGLSADDDAVANGRITDKTVGPVRFREDLYDEPLVENFMGFDKFVCPICAMGMRFRKFNSNKEYVDYLAGKSVKVKLPRGGTADYILLEEDLYLKV